MKVFNELDMSTRMGLSRRHASLVAVTEAVLAKEGVKAYLKSIGKNVVWKCSKEKGNKKC